MDIQIVVMFLRAVDGANVISPNHVADCKHCYFWQCLVMCFLRTRNNGSRLSQIHTYAHYVLLLKCVQHCAAKCTCTPYSRCITVSLFADTGTNSVVFYVSIDRILYYDISINTSTIMFRVATMCMPRIKYVCHDLSEMYITVVAVVIATTVTS